MRRCVDNVRLICEGTELRNSVGTETHFFGSKHRNLTSAAFLLEKKKSRRNKGCSFFYWHENHLWAPSWRVFLLQKASRGVWALALLKICPAPLAKVLVATGLARRLSFFFKMASRSLTEVVNELTDNQDLRAVFTYIFGTYGRRTPPSPSPSVPQLLTTRPGFPLGCRQRPEGRQLLHAQSSGHALPQRRLVPQRRSH